MCPWPLFQRRFLRLSLSLGPLGTHPTDGLHRNRRDAKNQAARTPDLRKTESRLNLALFVKS